MTRQATVLTQALASTPSDVARMARGREAAGDVRPVLSELLAFEQQRLGELRRAVDEERPDLAGTAAPGTGDATVAAFADARAETVRYLARLPVGGWARRALHPRLGETRLWLLVRDLLDHDLACLAQLADARGRTHPPAATGGSR